MKLGNVASDMLANPSQRVLAMTDDELKALVSRVCGPRTRFVMAAFHIHDEFKRAALEQGVTVLQRKGDVIESTAA